MNRSTYDGDGLRSEDLRHVQSGVERDVGQHVDQGDQHARDGDGAGQVPEENKSRAQIKESSRGVERSYKVLSWFYELCSQSVLHNQQAFKHQQFFSNEKKNHNLTCIPYFICQPKVPGLPGKCTYIYIIICK